jgi:hypothetical protein
MRFQPSAADRGPTIKYSTRVKGDDDDLEELRNFISRSIASRMAERLQEEQQVPWTSNLEFLPDGIRYRPAGLLGRKEAQILPYTNYGGYNLQQGTFQLFSKSSTKAIVTEQTSAENFYPGFFLLLMLLHEPAEQEAVAPQTEISQ